MMKDLGSMNLAELKEELKQEKALLRESERDVFLSKCEIKHLEEVIKNLEENNGRH